MPENICKIKMIVTDLDGTLLKNDGTISDFTLSVLRRCHSKGIKIVFATARTFRRVRTYLNFVPCDAVICHSGGAIYDGKAKISDLAIPARTASEILRGLNSDYPYMTLIADCDETLYANFDASEALKSAKVIETDFKDMPDKPVEKIYAGIDGDETFKKVRNFVPDNLDVKRLNKTLIHIANKEATKLNALKILTDNYGIALKETLAFGDDYSDIEMIRAAGKGIAVGNAVDEVKSAADEAVQSNDEDGVAHFIEKLLLL